MLSESQERMLLVAQKGREEEVFRIFQKWDWMRWKLAGLLDAKMRVLEHGEVVAEIPNARSPTTLRSINVVGALGTPVERKSRGY